MTMHAGIAIREISPPTPQFLVGYPHTPRVSTGVNDPLLASALCLHTGDGAVLLVAVDVLFMSRDTARAVRAEIAARTGIPEAGIFISCTHTHSGPLTMDNIAWRDDPCVPPVDPAYLAFFTGRIVDAAVAAAEAPHPAELAWTTADARGVGGNRISPDGVTDPEAGILLVRSNGKPLALVSIYGMHPTVLHEDSTLVSADFPGYTRQLLREALGEELVVLYHTAPCGDQSPRYAVTAQTFAEAERLGRILGARLLDAVGRLTDANFDAHPRLDGLLGTVAPLPRAMPGVDAATALLQERVATFTRLRDAGAPHGQIRTAECAVFGAEETVTLAHAQADGSLARVQAAYNTAEVQAVRIGGAALVGFPCELFTAYALAVKSRVPGRAFPVCLVNGELQGYIVTQEVAAAGGYEAANSLFTPETGALLVDEAVRLVDALFEENA